VEDLKVPRIREGDSHPQILPYRKRILLELPEAILALCTVGVSTRKISAFLEGICGAFFSPQGISRLIGVTHERGRAWRERPLSEGYSAVFLNGTFLSLPGEDSRGTRVYHPGNLDFPQKSGGTF